MQELAIKIWVVDSNLNVRSGYGNENYELCRVLNMKSLGVFNINIAINDT